MDEEKRDQFVNDLLEESLSHYGRMTPRPGLEGRVLANARAARERRTLFVWAGWLVAGAAATMIAVGVLKFGHRRSIPAPTIPAGAVTTAKGPVVGPGPAIVPKTQPRAAVRVFPRPVQRAAAERVVDTPHLTVFPSPAPETAQEKLMAQYVRETPPSVLAAIPADSPELQDLKIKKLEIPPLTGDANDTKNN
jgi:hypothetical protein